jgi:hypothetical protein
MVGEPVDCGLRLGEAGADFAGMDLRALVGGGLVEEPLCPTGADQQQITGA